MRRLDELHLEFPFAGSRMLRGLLAAEGSKVGRRHVTTLMRRMGIEAIYRRPNKSKPAPGPRIYAYLLRGLTIDRPNHVWATDITYIPMARGFVYLAAVMDWFARRVLAWRLSNTMEASFWRRSCRGSHCKIRLSANLQHRQFTSAEFTGVLTNNGISISMDGKLVARQRLRRALLANHQVRGSLSARL
jgi:putative transposase